MTSKMNMDSEFGDELLSLTTASVGFLVMATCHEIEKKKHRHTETNLGETMHSEPFHVRCPFHAVR